MESRPEKTLVVETGILCNNHCAFCYQNGYRRISGVTRLIDVGIIRERILWGASNGYSDLSLTGGEPTIRKDFVEILRYAKDVGYQHISVTTNGSRLCDVGFFKESVMAGLDGMGVSIHGISSQVHDAVAGRDGAFAQAVRAIRNGARTQQALGGKRFRLNTFSVIHKDNVRELPALTDMLAGLGVKLMILQPPVVGKSNVSPLAEVSLDDVVDAVRRAARAAVAGGYLIKPFNIPPCMLPDVADGLDMTMYSRQTFRENDDSKPGARSHGDEVGFVRLPACERCAAVGFCSGLSLTLLPEPDLVKPFMDIVSHAGANQAPLWLTGTEFLTAGCITQVINAVEGRFVWLCTGGSHRAGAGVFEAVRDVRRAGGTGIAFIHQAMDPASADRIICGSGNGDYVVEAFKALRDSGISVPVAVCGNPDQSFIDLLGRLVEEGVVRFSPAIMLASSRREIARDQELICHISDFCKREFGADFEVMANLLDVPVTPFENPLWSILNWSVPRTTAAPRSTAAVLVAESIDVKPL